MKIDFNQEPPHRSMSERAEQIAKDLDLEAKLRFYENWAEAIINGYFVFSDGSEIKVPVK